ncbi:MAG TPA: dipeptidase [Terracidiphilus sp.]|jgi:acetylornithine deacetylase/succinyl-diaminopimelate desuccinylase-like protein|nr:dipeptidase [Terracidiphilus sp.]
MNTSRTLRYAQEHRRRFVSELEEFLRFASVSSEPQRAGDSKACAHWLARHLKQAGLEQVKVMRTAGNPVVCGASRQRRERPTILIYGHYDVLPGGPRAEWRTAPFAPLRQAERLFARGASDDKGQLFTHVKAIESFLKTARDLPVNVKCLFEGEEEIGSPNLTSFIVRNRRALRSDAAVISDTRMLSADRPAISYAQRGGLRATVEIRGPSQDLHSGNFGGAVHNPIQVLCELIARLHDEHGRVSIPGFYDDVRTWSQGERDLMARTGRTDVEILKDAKVARGFGESGFSAYERTTIRPALTLNGMTGGHQGRGAKSIIPSRASAKLSFRLVPDQDPRNIAQLFRDHIERITPPTVQSMVRTFSPIEPAMIDRRHPALRTAEIAYERGFGTKPVFIRSGGSIPVVNTFQKLLRVPVVLMGFGLPEDNIHAPNESLYLPNFYKGIATSIWFLSLATKLPIGSGKVQQASSRAL